MDILKVKQAEYLSWPDNQKQALKLKVSMTSGLSNEVEVQQRILEYIYVNSLGNAPVTLADVNRRYSRPAKQYGTTVSTLVCELVSADVVCVLERHGVSALFSTPIYKDMEEGRRARGSTGDLIENLMATFE